MIILQFSAAVMLIYGIRELYLWVQFMRARRGGEWDDEAQAEESKDIRIIERNGFFYASPTQSEDKENSTFEWGVKRFRVEGEELVEDKNYGKFTTELPIKTRFVVDDDDDDVGYLRPGKRDGETDDF